MNTKNIMSFFAMLLILLLVGMGVIKIWSPEAISNETFVKLVVTFGLLTGGSILISLLTKSAKNDDATKTKNDA